MLSMNGHTVAVSPAVLQQFQFQEYFEIGNVQTFGMLFGLIESERRVNVHYAPLVFKNVPEHTMLGIYALGRVQASIEAAWHLRGWSSLGFWIAHEGSQIKPERLARILKSLMADELPIQELILITIGRAPDGHVEVSSHTYVSRNPMISWRKLQITNLDGEPLPTLRRDAYNS